MFLFLVLMQGRDSSAEFNLDPQSVRSTAKGGKFGSAEIGFGESYQLDTTLATKEVLKAALGAEHGPAPEFAVLVISEDLDVSKIYQDITAALGPTTRVFGGGTTVVRESEPDDTPSPVPTISLLTVRSEKIRFGVGSASHTAHGGPRQAAQAAARQALATAGKEASEPPRAILASLAGPKPQDALAGIEDIVGKNVPILGGSVHKETAVFGGSVLHGPAVAVAFLYTSLPVGWVFEAGYDTTLPQSGVITELRGSELVAIDGRPAWQVYDEWLDGRLEKLAERGQAALWEILDVLALNPIYQRVETADGQVRFVFTHPTVFDNKVADRRIYVGTPLQVGDRIHLSHGTWELLLNRIGTLPRTAKVRGGFGVDTRPILGFGHICAGVMSVVPKQEKPKVPHLLNYAMEGTPAAYMFTIGEQGFYPGIGNKHANLSTSFLVIGE
ncbi:MAG: FIST N-terminal domain-containing protein [Bryobacteraceae bacterium]